MPVGFKNGTDGSYEGAINALKSSTTSHSFIGIDQDGKTCVLKTKGNPDGHIISRGGTQRPNYNAEEIGEAADLMRDAGIEPAILVDCSHGNSRKRQANQETVLRRIIRQWEEPDSPIIGFMIESNLFEANQRIPDNLADLKYGVSITDECVGWESTERMLRHAYESRRVLV